MSPRKEAIQFADRELKRITDGLFGVIEDAVDYRREHPLRFYLFHSRMVHTMRKRHRLPAARRHQRLADWYEAKAYALDTEKRLLVATKYCAEHQE